MNAPEPIKPPGDMPGRVLSSSVLASGNAATFGASVAVLIILTYHMHGVDFPAGYEGALGGAITAACVYLRAIIAKLTGANLP